jgi:hypothetical protein
MILGAVVGLLSGFDGSKNVKDGVQVLLLAIDSPNRIQTIIIIVA